MKISCSMSEYSKLIRACEAVHQEQSSCEGCVLCGVCGEDLIEDTPEIQFEVTEGGA